MVLVGWEGGPANIDLSDSMSIGFGLKNFVHGNVTARGHLFEKLPNQSSPIVFEM